MVEKLLSAGAKITPEIIDLSKALRVSNLRLRSLCSRSRNDFGETHASLKQMKKHETLFRWIKSRSGLTFGGFFTLLLGLLFYLLFRKASTPLHEIGSVLYLGSNHLPAMAQNSAPSFIFALSIILIEAGLLGVQNKRHIFLLSVKWCLITIIFECLPLIPNLQRYSTLISQILP